MVPEWDFALVDKDEKRLGTVHFSFVPCTGSSRPWRALGSRWHSACPISPDLFLGFQSEIRYRLMNFDQFWHQIFDCVNRWLCWRHWQTAGVGSSKSEA